MSMERGWPARAARAAMWWAAGLAAIGSDAAAAAEYRTAPVPAWVEVQSLDASSAAPLGQVTDGVHYVLVDQQTRIDAADRSSYRHIASRALNERGAESVAHISIDFDPTYQSLSLHTLRLHRGPDIQDRLASTRIKLLQRETEIESLIYDGSKTLDAVLDDVRPGDIVEYAFSVKGRNPVFQGHEFGGMDMQWRVPVHRLHRRLLVPEGRTLQFRSYLTDLKPEVQHRGHWTEYTWRATEVPPILRENDIPSWYDPYAALQWSSFADWSDVARWAVPLYATPAQLTGPLKAEVERIASRTANPEQRLRAVLDFVQSQIRYLGIEIGPGSHAPRPPEQVLARRYGDCKDKVLLSVTMLRALGITAHPALVNTRMRQTVRDELPRPGVFNHVIFRARIGDRDIWLDPTRAPQKGGMDQLVQSNYSHALVVDPQTRDLTAMPLAEASKRRRLVDVEIDASKGFDQDVTMVVTTRHEGGSAEQMRDSLRNDSRADLERNYLNYYLRSYPSLSQTSPMHTEDDPEANRVTTVEFYRIGSLWSDEARADKRVVYLRAPDVKAFLARPDDSERRMPLALSHPDDVSVTLRARLPQDWSISPSTDEVDDPAFHFKGQVHYRDRVLTLQYRYQSQADHVLPDALKTYIAHLEEARDVVGYTLRPPASANAARRSTGGDWVAVLCGLLAFALSLGVASMSFAVNRDEYWQSWAAGRRVARAAALAAGLLLFRGPLVIVILGWVTLKLLSGSSWTSGGGVVLLAALACGTPWRRLWEGRWLRWAQAHVDAVDVFWAYSARLRLPHRPFTPPAPSASRIATA